MEKFVNNMLKEMLETIDVYVCSSEEKELVIHDWNEDLNSVLKLPIDYHTSDDKRYITIKNLDESNYKFKVGNTKYNSELFSKNGIDYFDIETSYDDNAKEDKTYFHIFNDDNSYDIFFTNENNKVNALYRIFSSYDEIVDVCYLESSNTRSLQIYGHNRETRDVVSLNFDENIENGEHFARISITENNNDVYRFNIPSNEIDKYFNAILFKVSHLIKLANSSINILNQNMYGLLLNHYDFLNDFFKQLEISPSLPMVDTLFEKYFDFKLINEKVPNEPNKKKIYE